MAKIITVMEAEVPKESWPVLEEEFKVLTTEKPPFSPEESFLIQNGLEPGKWQIIGIWKDWDTVAQMRDFFAVPPAQRVFQKAGAKPALSVFEIKEKL